jgi:nitrogen fixation protein FixH
MVTFVLFSIWSARQAATRGSQISDHNYYSKGLRYNSTRVEERAAASRGWQLETIIDGRILRFILSDNEDKPISQANGELTLYLNKENQVIRLQLTEAQPGSYWLKLPDAINGSLQARIEFEQQDARISRQLLVNL